MVMMMLQKTNSINSYDTEDLLTSLRPFGNFDVFIFEKTCMGQRSPTLKE